MASYVIYEKKDSDGVRHLFGNYGETFPTAGDKQLVYRDASGKVIAPVFEDVYLDFREDGFAGIKRASDGEIINLFIKDKDDVEHQITGAPVEIVSNSNSKVFATEPVAKKEPENEEDASEEETTTE